ncbi:hypothetical protein [Siphonobacter aquaeclarae]|uniref:IrrE N-terminal-like domain-containing protein n=1 Tax=Siphonobacter aquaeclarae TaxID=563176 RepID=A0A1G9HGC6_9BACT|nr:hypothetical protein [Siphonobacter aquaeclarae]SDL11947.1 hypothetical protein SAMN04488090_0043 [Siphonobacter aquaeclarae]
MSRNITGMVIELADVLSMEFSRGGATNLLDICEKEYIEMVEDDYGMAFDSMLIRNADRTAIHLNTGRGIRSDNHQGRIAIAHELGCYFIDLLENDPTAGTLFMHVLKTEVIYSDWAEKTAEHFAQRLLIPVADYTDNREASEFSMEVVKRVSEKCDVSLIFTLLSILEAGSYPLMAVFSRNQQICGSTRSICFPGLENKFRRWSPLPAGNPEEQDDAQPKECYSVVKKGDMGSWFKYGELLSESQLFEQRLYSKEFDLSVNLLWFEGNG